jgi:hypothetical protein
MMSIDGVTLECKCGKSEHLDFVTYCVDMLGLIDEVLEFYPDWKLWYAEGNIHCICPDCVVL